MGEDQRGHEEPVYGMTGTQVTVGLAAKYIILTIYGAWAAITEIPTFVAITSSAFAIGWALTVCVLAALALLGLLRTVITKRFRFEKWTSFLFAAVFLGYSGALIYRAASTHNWDAAPTSLIPLAVFAFPAIRWAELVRRTPRRGKART